MIATNWTVSNKIIKSSFGGKIRVFRPKLDFFSTFGGKIRVFRPKLDFLALLAEKSVFLGQNLIFLALLAEKSVFSGRNSKKCVNFAAKCRQLWEQNL
ncbi:MAG: hypothetical protein IJ835_00295 [Muribaculaceae bacterium]|nr:hypothetical protein [Muribaculaceae bacterium]